MASRIVKPIAASVDLMSRLRGRETFSDVPAPIGGASVKAVLRSMSEAGPQGKNTGPAIIRKTFPYQSFFSSVYMERAILTQPLTEPIVPATAEVANIAGYGIAVYPASESLIAVQFLLSGGKSGTAPFVMRPGEVYLSSEQFDGVRWGLPFGWLGGGMVQLRILQGHKDNVSFFGETGSVFHRVRLPVWGVASNPAAGTRGASPNWPNQFPWPNAYDFTGSAQKGQPAVSVDPEKLVLRLHPSGPTGTWPGGFRMRLVLFQTDDFDLQSDGQTYDGLNTGGSYVDFTWPPNAGASGFRLGGLVAAEFPVLTLDDNALRVGGPNAIAVFVDMDGALPAGSFVDVERIGTV